MQQNQVVTETEKYPVVCSWCGKVKNYSTVENSHGICPGCAEEQLKQYFESLDRTFPTEDVKTSDI